MNGICIDKIFEGSARTSIMIGENGSGKSRLLNELARTYLASGHKVVAIANSVHDQFTLRSSQFHFLGLVETYQKTQ